MLSPCQVDTAMKITWRDFVKLRHSCENPNIKGRVRIKEEKWKTGSLVSSRFRCQARMCFINTGNKLRMLKVNTGTRDVDVDAH